MHVCTLRHMWKHAHMCSFIVRPRGSPVAWVPGMAHQFPPQWSKDFFLRTPPSIWPSSHPGWDSDPGLVLCPTPLLLPWGLLWGSCRCPHPSARPGPELPLDALGCCAQPQPSSQSLDTHKGLPAAEKGLPATPNSMGGWSTLHSPFLLQKSNFDPHPLCPLPSGCHRHLKLNRALPCGP